MSRSDFDGEDAFFDATDTSDTSSGISMDSTLYDEHIGTLNRSPKSVYFNHGFAPFNLSSVHERRSSFFKQVGFGEQSSRTQSCHFEPQNDEILESERFNTMTRDTVLETPSCSTNSEMEKNCRVRFRDNHTEEVLIVHDEVSSVEVGASKKFESLSSMSEPIPRPQGRGLSKSNTYASVGKSNMFKWLSFPVKRKSQTYEALVKDYIQPKGPQRTMVERHKKRCMDFTSLYMDQEIRAHKGRITVVKFSPSGRYLATGGEDSAVKIWGIREAESSFGCYNQGVFSESKGKSKVIMGIEMLKKGTRSGLAIIPKRVYQIVEQPLHKFGGHTAKILDLSWSKSDCLLTGSMDKTVRLWQVGSDSCLAIFQHANYVTSVQFNPINDGEFISGSIDGKVRRWQISDSRVSDWVDVRHMVTSVCYRPDAKGFAVGCFNGNCRFYDIQGIISEHSHDLCICSKKKHAGKMITSLQYAPGDSGRVMITTTDSTIIVTDGKDVFQKYKGVGKSKTLSPALFTSDGRYIISVLNNFRVHIWNSSSFTDIPLNKKPNLIRSCETFVSENASIAIPWLGVDQTKLDLPNSTDSSSPRCFSLGAWFFPLGPAVTWPEEKLPSNIQCNLLEKLGIFVNRDMGAWGAGILTAGHDGIIRSFHNYGLPVRL